MKIKLLTVESNTFQSFSIRRDRIPKNQNIWHYHQELELIYIISGSGKLFVGDCIHEFRNREAILIGPNIPHYWLFELANEEAMDCIVVHYKQHFFGNDFLALPEASYLKELTIASQRVLLSHPDKNLEKSFYELLDKEGILRVTSLLEILLAFKKNKTKSLVSSSHIFVNHTDDVKRMHTVMEFIRENFTHKIELDELAHLAQMTKNSFSRYFKQKTGKTPLQLIFELRVSSACKLLNNPNYTLKEICFESGFNNFVSFHKIFKSIVGLTPTQYRKEKKDF